MSLDPVKTLSRDRNIEHWDAEDVEAWIRENRPHLNEPEDEA